MSACEGNFWISGSRHTRSIALRQPVKRLWEGSARDGQTECRLMVRGVYRSMQRSRLKSFWRHFSSATMMQFHLVKMLLVALVALHEVHSVGQRRNQHKFYLEVLRGHGI